MTPGSPFSAAETAMHETATLSNYAANLRYEDIPADVLERMKHTICDTTGAIIFGYDLPWSQMIVDYATKYGPGGRSRILGHGGVLVQPQMAALANGALAHAFELDGGCKPSVGVHPGATTFPAALAVAQERGFNGRDVITAIVAATEVMVRIAMATQHTNEIRGFHGPSTTGPFGAAVTVGRLLGFDATKMTNALGIAASLAGGLVQFSRSGTGGMVKRLHLARANESGVLAANLADRGFEGPHDILEGEFGFLNVFCNEPEMSELTKGIGDSFISMNMFLKRYACHGAAQGPLQALEDLQSAHRFKAKEIDTIDVYGHHEMKDRHEIHEPTDPMLAQYSVPFSIALANYRDPKDPRSFDQSALGDKDILALCKRVRLYKEQGAGHMTLGTRVAVNLKDGRVLTTRVVHYKGLPQNPANRNDVYEKFSLLTSHCPKAKMNEFFDRLQNIEKEKDFEWLTV
jgi:2-methylcitrate dehydratase PrpD